MFARRFVLVLSVSKVGLPITGLAVPSWTSFSLTINNLALSASNMTTLTNFRKSLYGYARS